jgi:hypothetical protein
MKKWSAQVTKTSKALMLESGVFTKKSGKAIAQSILRSVKKSRRKKGTILSSGMSMLNFYINRLGRKITPERERVLRAAKKEYRRLAKP